MVSYAIIEHGYGLQYPGVDNHGYISPVCSDGKPAQLGLKILVNVLDYAFAVQSTFLISPKRDAADVGLISLMPTMPK